MVSTMLCATLIILGVVIVLIPLAYIHWFLIIELPRKIGYLRFCAILFCYVIFLAILVVLISAGYVNLVLAMALDFFVDLCGVYYLKKEFIATLKKDLKIEKDMG
jgi:hypothetical protein